MSSSSTTSNTTPSSSDHQPLTDLSPNITSPRKPNTNTPDSFKSSSSATNEMPTTTSTITTTNDQAAATTSYISPSDAMLSPTTKKLSEIKGRRFASSKTGQTGSRALFQKAVMQGKENGGSAKSQQTS